MGNSDIAKDFTSVGIGRSRQGTLAPVSERHDEALVEAVAEKTRRSRWQQRTMTGAPAHGMTHPHESL